MAEYIEREAALKFQCAFELPKNATATDGIAAGMRAYDEHIKSLPAADVKPVVRGKWIPYRHFEYAMCCSVCGKVLSNANYSFCPYCGAEMEDDDDKWRSY